MSLRWTAILGAIVWTTAISLLHAWLNLGLIGAGAGYMATNGSPLRVGFLPVT
jgi:hypothetical protein